MAHSDKSRTPRHHPGHTERKRNHNREMRRLAREALKEGTEPPERLAGFAAPGFCCGNHDSDWRY